MSIDSDILNDFTTEAKTVLDEAVETLENIEGDSAQFEKLKVYGNLVDRIMGAAKSILMMFEDEPNLVLVADYTTLFKIVSYKSARKELAENKQFYDAAVAVLLDATEVLVEIVNKIEMPHDQVKKIIRPEFINRVKWMASFIEAKDKSMAQNEVDDLMKKLGFS